MGVEGSLPFLAALDAAGFLVWTASSSSESIFFLLGALFFSNMDVIVGCLSSA